MTETSLAHESTTSIDKFKIINTPEIPPAESSRMEIEMPLSTKPITTSAPSVPLPVTTNGHATHTLNSSVTAKKFSVPSISLNLSKKPTIGISIPKSPISEISTKSNEHSTKIVDQQDNTSSTSSVQLSSKLNSISISSSEINKKQKIASQEEKLLNTPTFNSITTSTTINNNNNNNLSVDNFQGNGGNVNSINNINNSFDKYHSQSPKSNNNGYNNNTTNNYNTNNNNTINTTTTTTTNYNYNNNNHNNNNNNNNNNNTTGETPSLSEEQLVTLEEATALAQNFFLEENQQFQKKLDEIQSTLNQYTERFKEISLKVLLLNNQVLMMDSVCTIFLEK